MNTFLKSTSKNSCVPNHLWTNHVFQTKEESFWKKNESNFSELEAISDQMSFFCASKFCSDQTFQDQKKPNLD